MLDLHDPVHGFKLGPEIATSAVLFPFELFDRLFELTLRSIDLLPKEVGPFLQIATDVTH